MFGSPFVQHFVNIFQQGRIALAHTALHVAGVACPLDRTLAGRFAGIRWHELNARHKRDYAAAAREAMEQNGMPRREADTEARRVLAALEALPVTLGRGRRPREGMTAAGTPRKKSDGNGEMGWNAVNGAFATKR